MKNNESLLNKLSAITKSDTKWKADAKFLVENSDWLDDSLRIASRVLVRLRMLGWTQVDLADALQVSPQQVNKWVKGRENFSLSTIKKLESALGTVLIRVEGADLNHAFEQDFPASPTMVLKGRMDIIPQATYSEYDSFGLKSNFILHTEVKTTLKSVSESDYGESVMSDNVVNIGFAFNRIVTEAFASFPDLYKEKKPVQLTQEYGFAVDPARRGLKVGLEFRFIQKQAIFLSIKVGCYFEIAEDAWNAMAKDQHDAIVVPPNFLGHLLMLSIGTVRGVLHAKTEHTALNTFILPTINVNEIIKEPVTVRFESA